MDKKHYIATDEEIQTVYEKIWKLEQTPQYIDTPEAIEKLERSLKEATDKLTSLILQKHLQARRLSDNSKIKHLEK